MFRGIKKYFLALSSTLLLVSCSPKAVSFVPHYTGRCKSFDSVTLFDNMDRAARSPMGLGSYYSYDKYTNKDLSKNRKIKRIEFEQSNEADANGVCIQYTRLYTRKAKSGYLYVNKVIMDSFPDYHHFRYSIDGDIVTNKSYKKLLKLKKNKVIGLSGDSKNNIINISTK